MWEPGHWRAKRRKHLVWTICKWDAPMQMVRVDVGFLFTFWWAPSCFINVHIHDFNQHENYSDVGVLNKWLLVQFRNSATGTRTRVARVRAEYPNQLDYGGHIFAFHKILLHSFVCISVIIYVLISTSSLECHCVDFICVVYACASEKCVHTSMRFLQLQQTLTKKMRF